MSISTYAELQDGIKAWLNAPEIDQSIPSFIALTEARLQREIRHHKMMQRAEADIDTRYFALPNDWLESVAIARPGWS
jgi:hypothetical protein